MAICSVDQFKGRKSSFAFDELLRGDGRAVGNDRSELS